MSWNHNKSLGSACGKECLSFRLSVPFGIERIQANGRVNTLFYDKNSVYEGLMAEMRKECKRVGRQNTNIKGVWDGSDFGNHKSRWMFGFSKKI